MDRYNSIPANLDRLRDTYCRDVYYDVGESIPSDLDLLPNSTMFRPQHYPSVNYLDLHSPVCYSQPLEPNDLESIHRTFIAEGEQSIKQELLSRMLERGTSVVRMVENLLRYIEILGRIGDEGVAMIRRCLTRLRAQNPAPSPLVPRVLSMLCSPAQMFVEDLASDYYTVDMYDYIFRSCAEAGFNFRHFLRYKPYRARGRNGPICLVLNKVMEGDDDFLKLLLDYGFERYETDIDERTWAYASLGMMAIMETNRLKLLPHFGSYSEYLNYHRFYLVADTLYLVCRARQARPETWTRCARLIYASIPDPYLSETELRNALVDNYEIEDRVNIREKCEGVLSDIFVPTLRPRTLKHLCRCAIRKALAGNFKLPSGIADLPLPQEIVRYLTLLEDFIN